MNRSSDDVEREVEASRQDLDRTVEALREKMTPGQLFDETSRMMGRTGQQVLSKFVEQAKENPMPLAVMGIGLAWLLAGSARRPEPYADWEERSFAPESGSALAGKAQGLKDRASEAVAGVKDRLASAASAAGESGRAARAQVGSMASSMADQASAYGSQAQQRLVRVYESEPLLIGAIGLIVGAAIGSALPPTEAEDRAVGPLRDRLVEKGRSLAQEGLQQAGGAAQAAYAGVKEELQQPTGEGDPAQRAEAAGRAAAKGARNKMQGGPEH